MDGILIPVAPWRRRKVSEAQLRDQLDGIGVSQGFEDIPTLLSGGGDDGAQVGEVPGALHRTETA